MIVACVAGARKGKLGAREGDISISFPLSSACHAGYNDRCVITVVKIFWTHKAQLSESTTNSYHCDDRQRKTTFYLFFNTIPSPHNFIHKMFLLERDQECDPLTRAALSGLLSYRQRQISQSDCDISSNCGKKVEFTLCSDGTDVCFIQFVSIPYTNNNIIPVLRSLSQPLRLSWFDICLSGMDWTSGHGFFTLSPI